MNTATNRYRDAGMIEGRRRRDHALTLLESRRAVYIRRARRAFIERLLAVGSATADDVRDAVELPPGISPKLFGCVPTIFARARIVTFDGFDVSRRPARHAGVNRRWRLVNAGAAREWLAKNPDRPDAPADCQDQDRGWSQQLLFPPQTTNDATPMAGTTGVAYL